MKNRQKAIKILEDIQRKKTKKWNMGCIDFWDKNKNALIFRYIKCKCAGIYCKKAFDFVSKWVTHQMKNRQTVINILKDIQRKKAKKRNMGCIDFWDKNKNALILRCNDLVFLGVDRIKWGWEPTIAKLNRSVNKTK